MERKINLKCPVLNAFYDEYIASRNWEEINSEISKDIEVIEDLWFESTIEYNTDTSAGHPVKDDDIVRYSFEKRRIKDKEP